MNQRLVIVYDPTLIHFGSDILKIVAVSISLDTANTLFFSEPLGHEDSSEGI